MVSTTLGSRSPAEALQPHCIVRNLQLAHELFRAVALLEAQGVCLLSFKGPTLGMFLHGQLGQRRFCDVDILVSPDQAQLSAQILTAAGYEGPRLPADAVSWRAFRAVSNHVRIFHKETGGALELHWDLSPPELAVDFPFQELWSRSMRIEVGGVALRTLGLEDLALYLCFHGWKHQWERLDWLRDIAALVQRRSVDWSGVVGRARSMGLLRILLSSLVLTRELFAAAIPAPCGEILRRDPTAERLASHLRVRMTPHWSRGAPAPALRPFDPWVRQSRERGPDRLRYLLHPILAPTPADVAAVPLPEALFGAYYLIRPVRLAFKYALLGTQTLLRRGELRLATVTGRAKSI